MSINNSLICVYRDYTTGKIDLKLYLNDIWDNLQWHKEHVTTLNYFWPIAKQVVLQCYKNFTVIVGVRDFGLPFKEVNVNKFLIISKQTQNSGYSSILV